MIDRGRKVVVRARNRDDRRIDPARHSTENRDGFNRLRRAHRERAGVQRLRGVRRRAVVGVVDRYARRAIRNCDGLSA